MKELVYYMFDWDDNILNMSTEIHMDNLVDGVWKPVSVSTSKFRDVRLLTEGDNPTWRIRNNDAQLAFCEFRDTGERGNNAFYLDGINSINNGKFAPVWETFIKCLEKGNLFMIITARGHEPNSIKKLIKWIIDEYITTEQYCNMLSELRKYNTLFDSIYLKNSDLVDNYLGLCEFIAVNSKYATEKLNVVAEATSPEVSKVKAVTYFTTKISKYAKDNNLVAKVGFSDDDPHTVNAVDNHIKNNLSHIHKFEYSVFHTTSDGVNEIQ